MTNITTEERKKWIGGSEIASLFGESPYATKFELWHRKAGNLPEPDLDNERVEAGNFFEPAIAAWAEKKFGLQTRRVLRYMPHPTVKGYGTSLDYETVTGHYPVEIKNVDGLVFRDNWATEGDKIIDAPMHIILQLQAQMACAKKDRGYLVACVGGNRLYTAEIQAHAGTQARMEKAVTAFWQSIDAGDEPDPNFLKDAEAIAELYRMAGEAELDLTGNNRLTHLCHEYQAASEDAKEAENRKKAAKAEMITIIGDAKKVVLGGFKISATTTKDQEVQAHTKKGYRNFRLYPVAQAENEKEAA